MIRELNLVVSPAQAHDNVLLKKIVSENLNTELARITEIVVIGAL